MTNMLGIPDQEGLPGYQIDELVFERDVTRIYRGKRLSDGMPVMFKSLRNDSAARDASASLKHEYEIAKELQVPGVIRVYGLEHYQQHPVVVLEDFGGLALSQFLGKGPIPLAEVLSIGIQVAQGLGEIHAINIIHKDINPSNIVYNPISGQVKIIDFGISTYLTREQAALSSPEVIEASLPYISPEQTGRMNRSIDYRSDFYSFGVTLFELLTGLQPFKVSEPIEWFHCHIAKQPPSPRDINPDIPQPVADIVLKMMAKMAEDRYQSAAGIQADLQQCLDQLQHAGNIKPFQLAQQDVSQRFQIPQRLYGREQEVENLLACFDRVAQGANELMLVAGYSGIGKTCLIREIYKPITERRGHFVAGKFDQLHRNVPYSAVVVALRDLVKQMLTQTEMQLNRWRERIVSALSGNGQIMVDILRELELVIGPQPAVPPLPPLEANQRFHHVFLSFIQVFAQPEHPLVIFLDDLQWADNASLNVLEMLTNPESRVPYLMVIGAYRDNEVHPGHPMQLSLRNIEEHGCAVQEIKLSPLRLENLTELLADTLSVLPEHVGTLAQLLLQKTGGNPFFTEEFLKALYKQRLIDFDREQRRWVWDVDKIQSQQMTDNVVELMTEKLQQLTPETQKLIKLAACIGNRFPLNVLTVVSDSTSVAIEQQLRSAMTEGVIAPLGATYQLLQLEDRSGLENSIEFAFAHDRIQQAAYALLDEKRGQEVHLKIGRLLLQRLSESQQQQQLFDITNHFNLALPLIQEPAERSTLSRLNREAGKRAKSSTAFQAAYFYLANALALLPSNAWDEDYKGTLELHAIAAEAAYLDADFKSMEQLLTAGYDGAKNLLDKVDLYLVEISALIARGRLQESLDLAKPIMAKLGHRYPHNPTAGHVALELFKNLWMLRKVNVEKLIDLPVMTNPRHLAATALGTRIGAPAMFMQPHLLSMMALRSVRDQYRFGVGELGILSWAVYGMVLGSRLFKPERGLAFGKLTLKLVERFGARQLENRAVHIFNAMVRHWKEPLRNSIDPLQHAYRLAMDNGDFEYGVLSLVIRMMSMLDTGRPLDQWHEDTQETYAAVKQLKQGHTLDYVNAYLQFHAALVGEQAFPQRLVGKYYDVEAKRLQHEKLGDKSLVVTDHDLVMWIKYLFGDMEGALKEADTLPVSAINVGGFYMIARSYLFDSLIRLANVPLVARSLQKRLFKQVEHNQRTMKAWAKHNPDNFHNKYCLVEAEKLRAMGKIFEAHERYDESIKSASHQGFLHEEALANERCGDMHMIAGRTTLGLPYLNQALECYQRWGAQAKVDDLQHRFPQLIKSVRSKNVVVTGGTTRTEQLTSIDITALMKALKAIAEEKAHGRMIELILRAALEFAAAQQGILILRSAGGAFAIEGEASIDGGQSRFLQSLPVEEGKLPQTLFNYVVRTKTSMVVHNAQEPTADLPGLNLDSYIQEHQVLSVLCLPILTGSGEDSELTGVLYLENNLASGTFTQERFDTLEIIAMSAAGRLELSRKASFDGLTGLFNHEYFQNMLRQEFASSRRYQRELGLVLIDIDHFKQFNDTWGHQVGDLVLREVANLIRVNCRDSDVVARYGGEEMVIIMPSTTMPYAEEVAERIRSVIENHKIPHGEHTLVVTISLGLAMLDAATPDKDALIRRADAALYESKRNGRNQVTVSEHTES